MKNYSKVSLKFYIFNLPTILVAIRDAQISFITYNSSAEKAEELFNQLSSEFPKCIPILSAEVKRLSKAKNLPALKTTADKLLEIADFDSVLKFQGSQKETSEDGIKNKAMMNERLKAIVDALHDVADLTLEEYIKAVGSDITSLFKAEKISSKNIVY